MLDLKPEDLRIVHRLDDDIKNVYEARMRFLMSDDPNDSTGMIDPNKCWDTAPPALFRRARITENGRWYIEGITPEAKRELPKVPEPVWSAIEGGRPIVLSADLSGSLISHRTVVKGQMEHGLFQGDPGTPVEIVACTMEECLFWHCRFHHVHFVESDFIKSKFIACEFHDCTVTDCFFDETRWGEKDDPQNTANSVDGLVVNGEVSFRRARGVGPGLFMPEEPLIIAQKDIDDGQNTWWRGEQLQEAIEANAWQ